MVLCHKKNHERGRSNLLIILWVDRQYDLSVVKVQVYLDAASTVHHPSESEAQHNASLIILR